MSDIEEDNPSLRELVDEEGGAVGVDGMLEILDDTGHDWVSKSWLVDWHESVEGPIVGRSRVITADLADTLDLELECLESEEEEADEEPVE